MTRPSHGSFPGTGRTRKPTVIGLLVGVSALALASPASAQSQIPAGTDVGAYLNTNLDAGNTDFILEGDSTWNTAVTQNAAHAELTLDGADSTITVTGLANSILVPVASVPSNATFSDITFQGTTAYDLPLFRYAGANYTATLNLNNAAFQTFDGGSGVEGSVLFVNGATSTLNVVAGTGTNGATFRNNVGHGDAAGVAALYPGTMNMSGDFLFENNVTDNYGGAISLYQAANVMTFSGGTATFRNNRAINYFGGAIDLWGGDSRLNFDGPSVFSGNHVISGATGAGEPRGGAINIGYLSPGSGATIVQFNDLATFDGNYVVSTGTGASARGGAISAFANGSSYDYRYVFTAPVIFENNYAVKVGTGAGGGYGGAIFYDSAAASISLNSGTQFLNNSASTFGGAIYLQAGTISLSAQTDDILFQGNRQGVSVSGNQPVAGTGTPNAVYLGSSGTFNLDAATGQTIHFYDPIASQAASTVTVNKTGAGEVIFHGDATGAGSLYNSNIQAITNVSGGYFTLANGVYYGSTAAGRTFTVGGSGTVRGDTGAQLSASALTAQAGGFIAGNGGTFIINAPSITMQAGSGLSGQGTLQSQTTVNLTGPILADIAGSDTLTLDWTMIGTGGITKNGTGTLILAGPNANTGPTVLNEGTLSATHYSAYGNSSSVTLNGGILDVVTGTFQIASELSGASGAHIEIGDAATLIAVQFSPLTYQGTIAGAGTLTKNGTAAFTLTGRSPDFVGITEILDGPLILATGNALGTSVVTVNPVATLQLDFASDETVANQLQGGGTLSKTGAGTATLTYAASTIGAVNVSAGTLDFEQNGAFQAASLTTQAGATTHIGPSSMVALTGAFTQAAPSATLDIDVGASNSPMITAATAALGGSELIVSGFAPAPGASASSLSSTQRTIIQTTGGITGDFAAIDLSGAASPVDYLLLTGGTTPDSLSYNLGYRLTWFGGAVAGDGTFTLGAGDTFNVDVLLNNQAASATGWSGTTLTKEGAGTLILSAANIYTGATVINAGTLQTNVVNSFAQSNAVTVASGATLNLNGFNQIVNRLSGAGTITLGSATLGLNNASGPSTFAGTISGTGSVGKPSGNTMTLTGTNTYTGGTTISSGTLQLGNGGTTGSIVGDVTNNSILAFNRSNSLTFAGTISGSGSLVQAGSGTTVLTGANSYAGQTQVLAGKLYVNGDQSAATGLTTVSSGAALGGIGIVGGDVTVADGGTLSPGQSPGTLTINGNLSLSDGSILDYQFGEAGVVSGPANDLIDVGGDLVLDGTLNVTVAQGGSFGPGLYRVINYAGALTDNGLTIGTIPSPDFFLQTSVSNEINLINTAGLVLDVWDGGSGGRNDGVISGGDGLWQSGGGNDNWSDASGLINAPFNNDTFALFEAAPGTVTVDNSLGTFSALGMQFAVDGYSLVGDPLELTGPQSEIRVGDGSTDGAAYTATIASDLTGTTQLLKTDLGTLILSGVNSYTGGTAIDGGVLQIASNASLGTAGGGLGLDDGTLRTTADLTVARATTLGAEGGTFETLAGTQLTLGGTIGGAGSLTKAGGGTLVLTGANTYTGGTTIAAGVVQLGNGGTSGSIVGNVVNDGALVFNRSNALTLSGLLSGSGSVLQAGAGTTTLSGSNTYSGGTQITAGRLAATQGGSLGTGSILNSATLELAFAADSTLANGLSGPGELLKTGAGNATLTGGGTADTVDVQNGTLTFAQPGVFTVDSTYTTRGGAVTALTGTARLGVTGALVQAPNATLDIAIGTVEPIITAATANLGGTLNVTGFTVAPPAVASALPATRFTVISTSGGISGNFSSVGFGGSSSPVDYLSLTGAVSASGFDYDVGLGLTWLAGPTQGNGTFTLGAGTTFTVDVPLNDQAPSATGWNGTELTKQGAGTLILSMANGYTGGTAIDGGVLQVSSNANLGAAAGGLSFNGGTLRTTASFATARSTTLGTEGGTLDTLVATALTHSGSISGSGVLTKAGGGTLVLTGTNSYSGGTTIAAGTLQLGAGGTTGSITGNVANNGTLVFNRSNGLTLAGAISGSGAVVQSGSGTTSLTGSNSYSGGTTVSAGTLIATNGSALGTGGVLNNSTLELAFSANGTLANTLAGTGQMVKSGAGNATLTGGGAAGGLVAKAGTLTLAPATTLDVGTSYIGRDPGDNGLVIVDGAGSNLDYSASGAQLYIGASGAGTLQITNGGLVTGGSGIIGQNTGSSGSVFVTGTGSSWTITDPGSAITLGDLGNGRLIVASGGVVDTAALRVATGSATATGQVIIGAPEGSSALAPGTISSNLVAFGAGQGSILFNHTAQDYVFDATINGGADNALGSGTGLVGTGLLEAIGGRTLFNSDHRDFTGTLRARGAGTLQVNGNMSGAEVEIAAGGRLEGVGTVGNVTSTGGTLAPGNSPGALTINGDLTLDAASTLEFEFGQANVAGGPLNDVINVSGDLVLDGTLDVTVSAGGNFAPGLYRIVNYGGTLADNGLLLGTTPGPSLLIQTAVTGQVNLVNTAGLALDFWDGATGAPNDGIITGGDGFWQSSVGNQFWTEETGTINATFADGAFALFTAAPGTVTVDNSLGTVTAAGMQFTVDGYLIEGDPLALVGPQSTIRVGDGSAAGAGFTATIMANLTGTTQLLKTDLGTLVLDGANTYTGGTAITNGTLQISSDSNLGAAAGALSLDGGTLRTTESFVTARAITLGDLGGEIDTAIDTSLFLDGAITGTGALQLSGAGTTVLNGANTYSGGTTNGATSTLIATSDTALGSGAVSNDGSIDFAFNSDVTLANSFSGSGLLLKIGLGDVTLTGGSETGDVDAQVGTLAFAQPGVFTVSNTYVTRNGATTVLSGTAQLAVGGSFTQEAGSTLNVAVGPVEPAITASSASLGGTLNVTGFTGTPPASASALPASRFTVIETTGGITGDFASIGFGGAASPVDYLTLVGAISPSGLNYDIGFGLAWFAGPIEGNGTFTLAAGQTFDVDVALADQVASATGWNGTALTKQGAGTLLLSAANSYTGGTVINGGVVEIGADSGLGAAGTDLALDGGTLRTTADIAMARDTLVGPAGGTFEVAAGTLTQGSAVSGAGALTKSGAGTLILAADNSYGGGTTIAAGALQVGQGGTTGSISGNVVTNGAIVFNRSDAVTFGGVISGSGSLTQAGAGTLTLTADNSFGGGTTITAGTLQLGSGGTSGSITGNVANNGSLVFDRSDTLTFAGVISGTGSVRQAGGGTTVLSGANSYGGPTMVTAGALYVNGDQSAATGPTSTLSGTTLGGIGTIGGDVVIADGATLSPGDVGAAPGTLTVSGDLSLGSGSLLAYSFGEAGVINGPINDLTEVGGDLVLDGTLNVTVSPGGTFGPGIYRVINYAGALTNNGLALGSIPSPDFLVQTSVIHEVNLINTAGLALDFWDGDAGPKNNGAVNGGDGVWQNAQGNDNWTTADGLVNAPFIDASFAIFEAAPGVVTVDGSLGAINVAGMQFASDGYVITGDAIQLVGSPATPAETHVRVGDGTTGGAGYVATIEAALAGPSGLVKEDLGTLILSGPNTYAGPTRAAGGTLLVNGDQSGATGLTTVEAGATLGGSGIIGGDVTVADDGILAPGDSPGTLTINGNLALSGGAVLNYEFGEAGVVGGSLNDLTVVGGDLVLDGTLNVAVSAGGTFATGIYRVFDYAGALTDNGLELGTVPVTGLYVQTSIANQVNLVNDAGLTLNYWDGAAGPKNNNVVNGGTGLWQSSAGNDNWTDATGALNAPFSDGSFAIFMGAPGTVSVDNSLGTVTASGMQFLVDGYVIDGDALTLAGPLSELRVGDGTAAGAGYTATIAAGLTGASELVKSDLGTLILTGANDYAGGTLISAGTLQLGAGGTSGTILGDVANNGTLVFDRSDTATFAGKISGSGAVTQAGSGTTVLSGANDYTGATLVAAGILQAGVAGSLSAASAHTVASGGSLALGGFNQSVGALANAGTVTFAADATSVPGTVLTVLGNYVGQGGTLVFNTALEGDGSATDLLRIGGNSAGSSVVQVVNAGGGGARTDDGIRLIDVTGTSDGVFELDGDFVTTTGQQAVVAGAYAYTLNQGGKADPADGDWYLRSELTAPIGEGPTPVPLFNPGTPLYENYAQTLLTMNALPTLRQRVGYRSFAGRDALALEGIEVWSRVDARLGRSDPHLSTALTERSDDVYTFNVGAEMALSERGDGSTLVGGLTARYGSGRSDVHSIEGNGRIETDGLGLGATLTWYGANGLYADAQAHYDWYDSDLASNTVGKSMVESNSGHGYGLSLEGGWQTDIGGGFKLTPQVQLSYSNVSFSAFNDTFDAHVSDGKGESLRGRLGLALDRETRATDANGRRTNSHLYVVPNLYYELLDGAQATVSDANGANPLLFANRDDRLWAGLGIGGTNSWNDDRISLFAEANLDTSLDNPIDSYQLSGRVGLRVKW